MTHRTAFRPIRLHLRVIPTVALAAALTLPVLHAQQTINYNNGDTDATNYATTYPNSTSLNVDSGSASHSGNFTGNGYILKTGSGNLTLTGSKLSTVGLSVGAGTLTLSPTNPAAIQGNAAAAGNTYAGITGTLVVALPNATPLGLGFLSASSGGKLRVTGQLATALANTSVGFYGGNAEFDHGTVLGGLGGFNNAKLTADAAPYGWGGPSHSVDVIFGGNNQNDSYYGTIGGGANVALNLVKVGTGTWTFDGALGTYASLEIRQGTVNLYATNASTRLAGGTLNYASSATYSGNFMASGTSTIHNAGDITIDASLNSDYVSPTQLTKTGAGTLTLNGFNTGFGSGQAATLVIAAGALAISDEFQLGAGNARLTLDGGALHARATFADSHTLALGAGGGTLRVTDSDHVLTWLTAINGTGSLTKTGDGTLVLGGTNGYTGATSVNAGTLTVNGSAAASAFTVNTGATLGGGGTVGALTLASGGILAPGNSPGTLAAGNTTFGPDGTFEFELNNATGATGAAGTNWDQLAITGSLTLTATSTDPVILALTSLTLGNAAGLTANFDDTADYAFTFVTTTGGISGFAADKFFVDTSAFTNPFSGSWAVAQDGNTLALTYTGAGSAIPEPSTYAMIAGLGALALAIWHRRR